MEAGRRGLETETRRRAGSYLVDRAKMGEEKWPKIRLKEEVRGLDRAFKEIRDR